MTANLAALSSSRSPPLAGAAGAKAPPSLAYPSWAFSEAVYRAGVPNHYQTDSIGGFFFQRA
jgi:hypothetical protein